MTDISFQIRFTSPFHVGTGLSRPGIADSAILRDRDGFPQISSETIAGVVRAGVELVADSLGLPRCSGALEPAGGGTLCGVRPPAGVANDSWRCPICLLFGSPFHTDGATVFEEASLGLALPGDFTGNANESRMAALHNLLSGTDTRSRQDEFRGRAQEDAVFVNEVAYHRLPLSSTIHVSTGSALRDKALVSLLVAGMRAVTRVGAHRFRGCGGCRLVLTGPVSLDEQDLSQEDLVNHLFMEETLKCLKP